MAEWIKEQDPSICCLQEIHFRSKYTQRLKVKGRKRIFHVSGNEKKAQVAILISDQTDFKTKNAIKTKRKGNLLSGRRCLQTIHLIRLNSQAI